MDTWRRLRIRWLASALVTAALLTLAALIISSPSRAAAPMSSTTRPRTPEIDDPCALPPPEQGRLVLMNEAVRLGLAEFAFRGTDMTTTMDLEVTNTSKEPITVVVPPGTPVEPDDPKVQKMITGPNEPITVKPGETVTRRISAYCTENFKKAPPSDGSVAMEEGERTAATEDLTAIVEAAEYLRQLDTELGDSPPGPMERANPNRFWASVALWSIYRTTDNIGSKEFNQSMLEQLQGRTSPGKAAAMANRITDETFEKVDLVYELQEVVAGQPLTLDPIRPEGKWCGQDAEEDGTVLISDGDGLAGEADGCKWKHVCVDVFVIARPTAGGFLVGRQGIADKLMPDGDIRSVHQEPDKLKPDLFKGPPSGLAKIKGSKAAPTINDQVRFMLRQVNRIWKTCCVKFHLNGVYAVDPKHFKNDLSELRKLAEKHTGKKCLKLFIIKGYKAPAGKKSDQTGRAQDGGSTSLVDDEVLNSRGRNEWIAAHEFGHNLGLGHKKSPNNLMNEKLALGGIQRVRLESSQCEGKLKIDKNWETKPETKSKPKVSGGSEGGKPAKEGVGGGTKVGNGKKGKTSADSAKKAELKKKLAELKGKEKRLKDRIKSLKGLIENNYRPYLKKAIDEDDLDAKDRLEKKIENFESKIRNARGKLKEVKGQIKSINSQLAKT